MPVAAKTELVIGRDPRCDVVVDDSSVSRYHAKIYLGPVCFIEDLGSTNRTSINGTPIQAKHRVHVVSGQVVLLGSATIVIQRLRRSSAPPSGMASTKDACVAGAGNPVVVDPEMVRTFEIVELIAPTQLPILILGETGVGKEVIADRIHFYSDRASRALIKLNCAAVPENLIESALFGHGRGAFTGAQNSKQGFLQAANMGTLFLDEIGELPHATQAKLLRVLETGEVTRIGDVKPLRVDVRVVCATNRNLPELVTQNAFRADLFYRINGATINVPPLRNRTSEILPLVEMFLERACLGRKRSELTVLSEGAKEMLVAYAWPGNIRELRNVIQRAAVLCRDGIIQPEDLDFGPTMMQPSGLTGLRAPLVPAEMVVAAAECSTESSITWGTEGELMSTREQSTVASKDPAETMRPQNGVASSDETSAAVPGRELREAVREVEKQRLLEALESTKGNQTKAAKQLGISRRTLINKMELHNLDRPRRK